LQTQPSGNNFSLKVKVLGHLRCLCLPFTSGHIDKKKAASNERDPTVEQQIADLAAKLAELEAASVAAAVTNTMFAETFYYLTIPLMILIHAGFLAYEMGASRLKNVLSSGVKNILAFAFVIPTFYFFGWWIYWGLPTGITGSAGPAGISGAEYANSIAWGWGDAAQYMGPNIADQASGVFFGAFALFAATTASIMSGAVIERIQTIGFIILAVVLGSFAWVVAAAWGWHADGWLVTQWGLHDSALRVSCMRSQASLRSGC